jgi:hypothetical protein
MTARHLSQGCSRLLGFVPAVFPILALPPRVIGQSQPLSLAYQLTHSINADPALTADGRRMVYISGGTHVSPRERDAFFRLCRWGLMDAYRLRHAEPGRYTWWDYRAGNFQKNFGMRIDHLLVTRTVAERTLWAEIDREARKGKPIPSDHAPLLLDLDQPGHPIDAGWEAAEARIAARTGKG